ncbi:MAG: FimV/HubP family polar landmark protein, partial [Colwellia sp.]
MQKLIRVALLPIFMIGLFLSHMPLALSEEELGIKVRGPKSSDNFPYNRYGPISQRDTLWNIALRVRPDNRLSVYQVMQALYHANPNSFLDDNVNHLVQGAFLLIPDADTMFSIDKETAKENSENADRVWQQKLPEITKSKPAKQKNVNKDDLNLVKKEINQKLETMDSAQQKQLKNIQYDVLNSIDGLEEILKENSALNERLVSVNEKLANLQVEVEQGKALKRQMDDIQALLRQAEAREKLLIKERQQAELKDLQQAEKEKQKLTSQTWFIALISTLPALIVMGGITLFILRKKKSSNEQSKKKTNKLDQQNTTPEKEDTLDELEEELLLDDDLSIDLLEESINEEESLADSSSTKPESPTDALDELDILDEVSENNTSSTQSDELDELDALLDEINAESESESESEDVSLELSADEEPVELSKEEDIGSEQLEDDELPEVQPEDILEQAEKEISSPDDIDDLLDEVMSDVDVAAEENTKENAEEAAAEENTKENAEEAAAEENAEEATEEVTTPDDIDDLLDEVMNDVDAAVE